MTRKIKIILIVLCVFFVAATAAAIAMGVLYGKKRAEEERSRSRVGSIYETTYYETMDNMDDVETKLGKIAALSKPNLQQAFLYDVWRQCGIAVSGLSRMAEENENTEDVIRFLNKTGDYCYYLSRKADDEPPTAEELRNVEKFKTILSGINRSLLAVNEKMGPGDKIDASVLADMSAVGEAIKNSSDVDYPELIYDGPFSDGLKKREPVFLTDKEEMAETACAEKIKLYFEGAEEVELIGENASSIPAYVYSFALGDKECTAQISKRGGFLTEFSSYEKVTDPQYTPAECVETAKRFLNRIGYENMECVWIYDNDSTVYLNFAYTEQDVVVYADLIKVKVSAQTGSVIGLEGQNYIYNHKKRTIDGRKTEVETSPKISVTGRRECIIPTEWGTEIRCLEIKGTYGGETYYVYYDSETGEETEAFVVIGDLLV